MRKKFTHLDFHARDRIEVLWKEGVEEKDIAEVLKVHKSTVSREINEHKRMDGHYDAVEEFFWPRVL